MDEVVNLVEDMLADKRDLPKLKSGTTTKSTTQDAKSDDNSDSGKSNENTSTTSSGSGGLPKLVTTTSTTGTGLPKLKTDLPLISSQTYTTPVMTVPPSSSNPFIIRTKNTNGTVFIAVGAILGAILLGFILYHLILSILSSRLAKKSIENDKKFFEKYQSNGNNGYGYSMTPQSTADFYSVAKLPLLTKTGLGGGLGNNGDSTINDTSTIYQSEFNSTTSKSDLTKMFISPTAEFMHHKRTKSSLNNSSNFSLIGSQTNSFPSPQNRYSQIPNLYINNDHNNSEINQLEASDVTNLNTVTPRKMIPSTYLEDLVGNK